MFDNHIFHININIKLPFIKLDSFKQMTLWHLRTCRVSCYVLHGLKWLSDLNQWFETWRNVSIVWGLILNVTSAPTLNVDWLEDFLVPIHWYLHWWSQFKILFLLRASWVIARLVSHFNMSTKWITFTDFYWWCLRLI